MQLFEPALQERLVLLSAVLVRVLVGLSSYSGYATPPQYGDYEAQRHWMELTTHLQPKQWYTDSDINNGTYWPLDYPPLSGYQSWVHGHIVRLFEPAAVAPFTSHGYETPSSKQLMRWTVLGSDLLFFFPAAIAAARALYGPQPSARRAFALAATLLNPALIIIDHGHFQYNCISLGLAAGGAAAIAVGRNLLGSFLFCAALNHKQMSLYYAPAFFAHLLGSCFTYRGFTGKIGGVLQLGIVVIASFALMWAPWLTSVDNALAVLRRIFPVKRGLYEDYVANWWCASSVVLKWKQLVPADLLVPLCAGITLIGALPSMAHQMWRPSPRGLIMAMANSASSFFMFSYQVHEKSVLLPLMPVLLLAGDQPTAAAWMPIISMVSMYPLLVRDGLAVPYAGLLLIWAGLTGAWAPAVLQHLSSTRMQGHNSSKASSASWKCWAVRIGGVLFVLAALGLHIAQQMVPPPEHLPWLYDRAFITLSFAGLGCTMLHLQLSQLWLQPQTSFAWNEQEQVMAKKDQ